MIHCNSDDDDDSNNNNNNNNHHHHHLVLSTLAVLLMPACISQAETMVIAEKSEFIRGLKRRSMAFLLCVKRANSALPTLSDAVHN
jgi:hypothetical protein